jgi:hypothetical protein
MSGTYRERFSPRPIGVNGTYNVPGTHIGGFLPTVAGTLTIVAKAADGSTDVTYLNAVPVTAGVWLKIPMEVTVPGIVVTLAGGAAGTLFI